MSVSRVIEAISRRRRAQSFTEFSVLAMAVLGFILLVVVGAFYLLQAWSLSNVAEIAGKQIATTGYLDQAALQARAVEFYVGISPEKGDEIRVEVRTGSNNDPLCTDSSDGRTCVYNGWTTGDGADGLDPASCSGTSGCPGSVVDKLRVRYGDYIRVVVVRTGRSLWLARWFGVTEISAAWSGIAQRNTVTSGFDAPNTKGSITVTVSDNQLDPVEGATVVVLPGASEVTTPSSGIANFEELAPGTYTVTAYKDGYQTASIDRTVRANYQTSYELILSDASYVDLYATTPAGGGDLAQNGRFSASAAGWSVGADAPDPLAEFAGAPDAGTVAYTGSGGYEAGYGSFSDADGQTDGGIWTTVGTEDSVTSLRANHTYRAILWVKGTKGSEFRVTLGASAADRNLVNAIAYGGWQQVTVEWTPLQDADSARLAIRDARSTATGTATFGVDEALVYDLSEVEFAGTADVTLTDGSGNPASGSRLVSGTEGLWRFSVSPGTYSFAATCNGVSASFAAPGISNASVGAGDVIARVASLTCE